MIEKMDLDIRNGRIPFFDLIKKKKSKSSFRNKFEMLNRYFKSHGLKLGKITLHKANMEDDIKDFDITYVNNTNNISKVCQTAKEECLLSEVTYNKFIENINNYKPREFILENLSFDVCENKLINLINNM